ncbi:MAG TPA: ATP-binding protein [Kofleriaceae bacterium]|nr:ATP-binding protein [Kofleriaceae bacterium]
MQQWKNERRTRAMLRAAFGGIAALLLVSQGLGYVQWRTAQRTVTTIQGNALAAVRLIGRMGFDFQRERILIDRHIFEHISPQMAAIERQIDAVKADYAAAAREYAPLVAFDGEAPVWFALAADVAIAERQAAAALRWSRTDRDTEAARVLTDAEPAFEAVERDVQRLIDLNQAAADRARTRAADMEAGVLHLGLSLAAAVLLITLLVGRRLTHIISDNERTLGQRTIELQNKNRELDAFAGRVSHDLRGPLNTISVATSILAERAPDQAGTTAILQRGVTRMTTLVDDLLALSRAGGPTEGAVARPDAVAATVAADLRTLVTEAGGTLQVDVEPAAIRCSDGLLRQALWNLGENAVKYRRPDVALELAVVGRTASAGYELRVSDNGIGMSADDARHAFEPFFRARRAQTIAGTGLGLAIVRRIVEASGGTVSVDSEPEHGTAILLRFVLAPAPAGTRPPAAS